MCGRFVSSQTPDALAEYFGADVGDVVERANFNVAPTHDIPAVVADSAGDLQIAAFHWGLVPSWAKDTRIGSTMINARSETLAEKPAFKGLLARRRCIIPMDGFYEWRQSPSAGSAGSAGGPVDAKGKPIKQPMYIYRVDGQPLAVAGLWTVWRDKAAGPDSPWLHSCTVITTAANSTMAPVHDRMPVILAPEDWNEWLAISDRDPTLVTRFLIPAPDDVLTMHAVSTAVNKVANNDESLIERSTPG